MGSYSRHTAAEVLMEAEFLLAGVKCKVTKHIFIILFNSVQFE